ncbi:NAD(P)-dependent oxidoreductase [Citreicella sp. C3M06]|uniref:NAD-dependent epimerase/dehydratase family protein n=1 Tax=Citreicella sp. C3M06 TaxID=2841564 RepID=UPI001C07F140|nr:NAD(P)-dependent oxidoreductase [Citreicella sp. C3M06]MBU2959900.1 NAD(P)-dependent oxidoreductase [Citreicella sp. C3M06]
MPRSIAITGGAGFVGLALAEALRAQGDRVTLLDIAPPDPLLFARPELAGTQFHPCDILQPEALAGALRTHGRDALIHAAAITPNVETTRSQPLRIAEVNVQGALNALRAVADAGVRDMILLSSISVYGSRGSPGADVLDESAAAPNSLYGETKLAAETLCARIAPLLGVRLATLRLGAIFGPWESLREARPDLSPPGEIQRLAALGRPVRLANEMRSDWVYSRDAAMMIASVLPCMDAAEGRIFNIGGGHVFALTDWAQAMGLPAPLIDPDQPDIAPRSDPRRPPMSITALKALSGIAGSRPMIDAVTDERRWRIAQPEVSHAPDR